MQTSGVRATFYTFFGQVKNLAHVCEFVWSLRTIVAGGLPGSPPQPVTNPDLDMMRINPDPDFGVPRLVPSQAPDLGTLRDVRDFREVGVD